MQPGNHSINSDDEDLSLEAMLRLREGNSRRWLGYWTWKDKPVGERNAVREAFAGVGLQPEDLRSLTNGQDPPDCECSLDGRLCGVEVAELVHAQTMKRSLKALKIRQAGGESAPHQAEAYLAWERDALLAHIQALIDRKDRPEKLKGGPYHRYFLVIVTDEFFLDRDTVTEFLQGALFNASLITDVFFALSYHPSIGAQSGGCPVFALALARH